MQIAHLSSHEGGNQGAADRYWTYVILAIAAATTALANSTTKINELHVSCANCAPVRQLFGYSPAPAKECMLQSV